MLMRSYLYLAAAAASAVAMAFAVSPAEASTGHVLTISKAGGTAVKAKAVLKAGVASGKNVTFATSGGETLTCTSSSFSATVKTNPAKPGKATESLTKQTFSKCTVTGVSGATVNSVKAGNLPYSVTVNDKGDTVTVSGTKSKPLTFTASVTVSGIGTVTCTDSATSITGKASNTGNTITFTKQKFGYHGSNPFCTGGTFSATFGPVTDTSVKGDPKVFVN